MVLQPLRDGDMRILVYLLDLNIMGNSREGAMLHKAQLISHLFKLGFMINWKRNSPLPHQQLEYLGAVHNARRLQATLSGHRLMAFLQAVCNLGGV